MPKRIKKCEITIVTIITIPTTIGLMVDLIPSLHISLILQINLEQTLKEETLIRKSRIKSLVVLGVLFEFQIKAVG